MTLPLLLLGLWLVQLLHDKLLYAPLIPLALGAGLYFTRRLA